MRVDVLIEFTRNPAKPRVQQLIERVRHKEHIMDIRFQTAMTCADVELAEHALRTLLFRLQDQSNQVDYIEIKLGNSGGRRFQKDSYCIVSVKLHDAPASTVVDIGTNVYNAIDRASDRVCRLAQAQMRLVDRPRSAQPVALAA